MKRGLCIILLACMFLTACAGKGKTKTEPVPHKNIYSKDECTVNYESAISKCAGAPGTEYEAYKFVDDDLEYIHSEKEWVDENGHLRIPFSVDDSLRGHMFSSFYIPDSLVRKASSEELVEVYSEFTAFAGWGGSYFFFDATEQMTWLIRSSNILQELMRRDDFAEPFYNKYMTTEFPEYMDEDYESQEFIDKSGITIMLFTTKFILAQPEACDQLTPEQRVNLVKRLVKETELTRKDKIMPYYGGYENLPMPDCNFFTWVVEGNSWYYAINDMALTADEWKVIDSMVEWNEKEEK